MRIKFNRKLRQWEVINKFRILAKFVKRSEALQFVAMYEDATS